MDCINMVVPTNPCKCGYYGDKERVCKCTKAEVDRYQSKLSGPFSERIDMCIEIQRVDYKSLTSTYSVSSQEMRERVERARSIQKERYQGLRYSTNSEMDEAHISEFCFLGEEEAEFMKKAYNHFKLSPRRYHKILKLSRTMADMSGRKDISTEDLSAALSYTKFFNKYDSI